MFSVFTHGVGTDQNNPPKKQKTKQKQTHTLGVRRYRKHLPMVQCSPFQPWWHWHLPSLQVPCLMHSGLQTRWSHPAPVQPSSQRHAPPMHTPWVPQSTEQTSGSGWDKFGSHTHNFSGCILCITMFFKKKFWSWVFSATQNRAGIDALWDSGHRNQIHFSFLLFFNEHRGVKKITLKWSQKESKISQVSCWFNLPSRTFNQNGQQYL